MSMIVYKKTRFVEPAKMPATAYASYKRAVSEDANFVLAEPAKSFTGHFKRTLKRLAWWLAGALVVWAVFVFFFRPAVYTPDGLSNTLLVIGVIVGAIAFGCLLQILLEGPSYATFIKDRDLYFERMKIAIKENTDYDSFHREFYAGGKKSLVRPPARQESSIDRFLTNLFHLIDKYYWILALVALAVWLGRKWLFQ